MQINKGGENYSYDTSELIVELESDLQEFGDESLGIALLFKRTG